MILFNAKNVYISRNIFESFSAGIHMTAGDGGWMADTYDTHNVEISGNSFRDISANVITSDYNAKAKRLDIRSNTFTDPDGAPVVAIALSGSPDTGSVIDNQVSAAYEYDFSTNIANNTLTIQHQCRSINGIDVINGYAAQGSFVEAAEMLGIAAPVRFYKLDATSKDWLKTVYYSSAPTLGRYIPGDRVINTAPTVGQPKAWVHLTKGQSVVNQFAGSTGDITINTKLLTLAATTNLSVGDFITIAGVTGVKEVMIVDHDTKIVTIDTNADATVDDAAVAISPISFQSEGNL